MRILSKLPLAAFILIGACASESTAPTLDVDALVAQTTGGGFAAVALSASMPGAVGLTLPAHGSPCAYSAAAQRFECPAFASNGLTMTRSYVLLDASGQSVSTPNLTTVVAIRVITDMKGTLTGAATPATFTIDRHEDATMSGLHSDVHTLNGTSTMKFDFSQSGTTASSSETSTTANLQLPKPTAASHWPLGGTITTNRTMTNSGASGTLTSHEVMSFDGTSVMTLTMTTAGKTTTCKFDLAKPATASCTLG